MKSGWKHIAVLCLLLALSNDTIAQPATYSFAAIDTLQQADPRPVVVFIHTDWCRFCSAMKTGTFTDEAVVEVLNEHFYFVDFDGESTRPVIFKGRTYNHKPTGANTGVHELAEVLGSINGKIAYPTLCILNSDYEIIFQHNSFMNADELMGVLDYLIEIQNPSLTLPEEGIDNASGRNRGFN